MVSGILCCCLPTSAFAARVLKVGSGKTYTLPSQAAVVAQDGDTIEIDAGVYSRDAATWKASNLTIRGVSGRARLEASGVSDPAGKAIWVIQGTNTTVENIEFSGAVVPDGNGAGIRQEGNHLTVRNCFFRDNQMGILTSPNPDSEILIESSEFARNGAGDGQTHNIYIGAIRTFTLRYSYSHDSNLGQLVKSRAVTNYILYNRLVDQPGGKSNYEIDLPNGGVNYIIGNIIYQSENTDNYTILTHAPEGASNPRQELYVINNTFVNGRAAGGTFIQTKGTLAVEKIVNNLFVGAGTVLIESGISKSLPANNLQIGSVGFLDFTSQNYRLAAGSPAIDKAVDPGTANGVALLPSFQYLHPLDKQSRSVVGSAMDLGAYEFGISPPSNATLIEPPQNLVGAAQTSTSIRLSWGPASSPANAITSYKVFRNGSLLTTASSLTATDTNVTPTTGYTYYVRAVADTGQESGPSSAVTLATPRIVSGSLPPESGWFQLNNTKLRPLCPAGVTGNSGCSSVIEEWSGGAFDTKRNRLILWGGGPNGYFGNELYALNLNTLSMSRLTEPAKPYADNVEALAGGTQPNSRHTYDGLAYMENVDRLFAFGGGGHISNTRDGSIETWTFDFASNKWQWMHPTGANPTDFIGISAYDPNTGKVFVHDRQCLYSYDFNTNSYVKHPEGGTCTQLWPSGYWMTGVLDPVRRKFFLFGKGDQWVYDVGPNSSFIPQAFKTTGGDALVNSTNPGLAYDPVSGHIVGWNGGDTVYVLDSDTKSWAAIPYVGGPGNPALYGTFKRWNYSPTLKAFVVVNGVDRDAFALRLKANLAPPAPLALHIVE